MGRAARPHARWVMLMNVLDLRTIKEVLPSIDLLAPIEAGFVAYSEGRAMVPPVGEMLFDDPPGEVHIKYGCLAGDPYYVIKIASGFYENPKHGLASNNGLMLLFSRRTGEPVSVLLDEGHLTALRTAAAGAIAARYLAPRPVRRIGILGCGMQARLQLRYLAKVTDCRRAVVWGRRREPVDRYRKEMEVEGFSVEGATNADDVADACNLIVTTTPSTAALLRADRIRSGTHITAVGADTPQKRELDPAILARADRVVADSIPQCLERGEIAHAIRQGRITKEELVELGAVIAGRSPGRTSEDQVTVADLTGVAVQDIQIARAVHEEIGRAHV